MQASAVLCLQLVVKTLPYYGHLLIFSVVYWVKGSHFSRLFEMHAFPMRTLAGLPFKYLGDLQPVSTTSTFSLSDCLFQVAMFRSALLGFV
uniref:Uncharacterized protein n=1 Tax=Arion vulgaris TaxID=1028688 RepID=A0A0B7B3A8_9EUPU